MANSKLNYEQFKEKNTIYWEYFDFHKQYVGTTYKKTYQDGSKKVLPIHLDNNNYVIFEAPKLKNPLYGTKPLYNENLLSEFPNTNILIVEGEKTADFCNREFPNYITITWLGGSSSAKYANIEHLQGRNITLWPDNDDPGKKAVKILAQRLDGYARSVKIAKLPNFIKTKGWDLADLIDCTPLESEECLKAIELAVNYISEENDRIKFIHLNDKDKPLPTTENLQALLDFYDIKYFFNEMTKQREFHYDGKFIYEDDKDNSFLNIIKDLSIINGLGTHRTNEQLTAICQTNAYHPVKDWILSRNVADPNIIYKFLETIPAENKEMSQHLLLTWLIQGVAILFGDHIQQGVLVLQGEQGTYKSTFVTNLVPLENAVFNGHVLDTQSVDSIRDATSSFITELGELDGTFRKSDVARLKSFITQKSDRYRVPYAANSVQPKRKTVFVATVNDDRFLVDDTGNRRWWTIRLTEAIKINHGIDMQQVWRAAYELWKLGAKSYLDENELKVLDESQQDMKMIDPLEELLFSMYDWNYPSLFWKTPSQVCKDLGVPINRANSTKMGVILKDHNIEYKRTKSNRLYKLPRLF